MDLLAPPRPPSGRSTAIVAVTCLVCVLWQGTTGSAPATAQLADDQAKASHLLNFSRYTEWPSSAFPHPDEPMFFCFLGDQPSPLGSALQGKTSQSRRVLAKQVTDLDDLSVCQVLFIPAAAGSRIPEVLAEVRDEPVLTVSDADGFLGQGGIIGLRRIGDRLRFEVNQDAATRARLKLSSTLLGMAHQVKRRPGEPR